jgi:capsular polysaccharide biosynthesis protein
MTYSNIIQSYLNNILNDNIIEIDNGYLFYSFNYQLSYTHFMVQTAPKIMKYINEYSNYKLLIPKKYYNNLYKDIIKYTNIDTNNIILLNSDTNYFIKNFIEGPSFISPNGNNFTEDLVELYKLFNKNISLNIIPYDYKKIYLKKDHKVCTENNNIECGIFRYIINEEELIEKLKEKGYLIITLGDKTLEEKFRILRNAETIITQLGANCMNFIFLNKIKNILLLSNTEPICHDYYISLSKTVNNIEFNSRLLQFQSIKDKCDPKNSTNSPFTADINMILNYANTIDDA